MLKHKLQWLVLLAALLGVSHVILADTYTFYVYGIQNSEAQNITSWTTYKASFTGSSKEDISFTLTDDFFTSQGTHYFGLSTASSNYYLHPCEQIYLECSTKNYSTAIFDNVIPVVDDNCSGNCRLAIIKYILKSDVDALTVRLIGDQYINLNNCSCISNASCPNNTVQKAYRIDLGVVTVPSVTTKAYTNLSSTSVTLSGTINSAGASAVSASGIKVFQSDGETLVRDWSSSATSGDFSIDVTGLSANTTYQYQAYATNASGTGTGSKTSFTTAAVVATPPTVRWANAPAIENPSKNLVPSAYIATHGCNGSGDATITKLRLYIKKGADPTTSSYDKMYEFTSAGFSTGTVYTKGSTPSVYVPGTDEFLRSLTDETVLHMGFVAINNNSTNNSSAMSDIATINYQTCSGGVSTLDITPAGPQLLTGNTTFTATVNDDATGTVNYVWKVDGVQVQSSTSSTYSKNVTGSFNLDVTASNNTCGEQTVSTDYTTCSTSILSQSVTVTITSGDTPAINSELPLASTTFSATLSGSNNADKWEWLIDGVKVASSNTPSLTNSQTIDLSTFQPGNYTLTVRALGCPSAIVESENIIKLRNKITPSAWSETINACEATYGNRFLASHLFNMSPDDVTVTTEEDERIIDVTSKFKYEKGYLYYIATSDDAFDSKVFYVTAHKTGFSDATATLTLTFQKVIPSGTIVITDPDHDGQAIEPWQPISLTAEITGGAEGDKVVWSVYPTAGYVTPTVTDSEEDTEFRGPGKSTGIGNRTYTITARIQSATCGTSEGVTRKIDVTPDADEDC